MTEFNKSEHTTRWCAVKNLSILWAQSQRELNPKHVEDIANDFDPDFFGVIAAGEADEDGVHHIIDGQHRVAAIKKLYGETEKVPVNVFPVSDPARAAEIFDKINTSRRGLGAVDKFKTRITAGIEPETSVNKIIVGVGLRVVNSQSEGCIRAASACVSSYKTYGPHVFKDALVVLIGAWGRDHEAFDAALIKGFSEFLFTHGAQVDKERLVHRISKGFNPARLIGQAKQAREFLGATMAEAVSSVLVKHYNTGLRKGRLDDG